MGKIFFGFLAGLCFGLGTMGLVMPMLPTAPFYLATAYCAARSSNRLHARLVRTRFYRRHLDEFVQHRSLTLRRKLVVMTMVCVSMLTTMFMINHVVMYVVIPVVLLAKAVYFFLRVKTSPA